MDRKKIYVIYQYFGTSNSKWSTRWYDFSQELYCRGYDVSVITSNFVRSDLEKVYFFKTFVIDNIKITVLPFGDGNNYSIFRRVLNSFLFMIFTSLYLVFVRGHKYIFSSGPITAAFPIIFKKRSRTILEIRDLWPDGGFVMKKIPLILSRPLYLFQKIIYNSAGKIITCSPAQLSHIKLEYPNLAKKISCVEHGIDPRVLNFSQNLVSTQEENITKYWVVVATLGYIHDPFKWVELAKGISVLDQNVKIILIGSGPLEKELSNYIINNGLKNIILTGQLNKIELSKWVIKAEFCLFTTLNNSVQVTSAPNKIYDYLAFKKPILIDLEMWHLDFYKEIIFKVDFLNFTKKDLKLLRNKKNNINPSTYEMYINKLDRKKLVQEYIQ